MLTKIFRKAEKRYLKELFEAGGINEGELLAIVSDNKEVKIYAPKSKQSGLEGQ